MAQVAVDFGTGNTVLARYNVSTEQVETLEIPGVSTTLRYRLRADQPEQLVHVIPSLIHYGETETLIGDQVVSRGLAEHRDTCRWMKRGIGQRVTKKQRTAQGHKSPAEAGQDFLAIVLNYAANLVSRRDDEFTFTAPTEAFEHFEDWLRRVCESVGVRRLRLIDEPTACVLGYHGASRKDDRFLVFDFGCGTLDVAAVRIDLAARGDNKAVQLGRAGRDLGGMDIDSWLAEDFSQRHGLDDRAAREWEALVLRQAEAVKIALSDPSQDDADLTVLNQTGKARLLQTKYRRSCADCERGRAGQHAEAHEACLGCLLLSRDFVKQARETIDRALENAAVKAALRRDDVVKVLVTGGTSLVPSVRKMLMDSFDSRGVLARPFDAVARGACRGIVVPILQHDYALKSHRREKGAEFSPLFRAGTEYPTDSHEPIRKAISGTADGQTRCGLMIYEVSRMKRRAATAVDANGVILDDREFVVGCEFEHVCLNADNPTFIVVDPPVILARDAQRFLCSFVVDGQRRLLVTVVDKLTGKTLLQDKQVVRL